MYKPLTYCRSDPRFVGDPIDVVTGANIDVSTDLAQRGPLPFQWKRYYNSARSKIMCSLGWGHSHGFDVRLVRDLDGLRYEDPSGGVVGFPDLVVEDRAAVGGMLLIRNNESSFTIVRMRQPNQEFEFPPNSETARLVRLRQGEHTIELRYADNGTLRGIIDSLGRPIQVISDDAGRILQLTLIDRATREVRKSLLTYEYDSGGNIVRAVDVYKTTLSFAYDAGNRMTRRTDRRGYSFYFAYDDEGRCIHSRGEDGLFEVSLTFQPYTKTTLVRRGDGGDWVYVYNDAGSITHITDPYGGVTKFILDDAGRTVQEIDPNGNVTELHYNSLGQHDYRIDPNGYVLPSRAANPDPPDPLAYELPETPLEWEHGHLLRGRDITIKPTVDDPVLKNFPHAVVKALLDSEERSITTPSALNLKPEDDETEPTEDEQGRPVAQGSSGYMQVWRYDPNGNLAEHQDRDGAVYRYSYRSWNGLHQEIDPLGNITVFHQSPQGLVDRVQDPGGTLTEYAYDLKDRLIGVRSGEVVELYRYDSAANIIEKSDGQGYTLVKWEVGRNNLDVARHLKSGETHRFEYDERGRIVQATTPDCAVTFAFAPDGERLEDKRNGIGVVHGFENGQLASTTCLDKSRTIYQTDKTGECVITDPTGACHRIAVSESGVVAKQLTNRVRELSYYDGEGRCHRRLVVSDGVHKPFWMQSFSYSRAGDLLSVTDNLQGQVRYRYDVGHRLAEEVLANGKRRYFSFDAAGNILMQPELSGVQMASGNRLQTANGDQFSYDDRDRLISRQGKTGITRYQYNALDMLVRCEINGESWTASYDALCRRICKTWRGQTTTYYWDDFRLAAEVQHDGSLRIYIYEDHLSLVPFMFIEYANEESDAASGRRYYIFINQVGLPIRVEDDSGRMCWNARIDPYGFALVAPESTIEMSLRFPGHYHDPETGLHYNRFRYFSPDLARYLQPDPAGQEGGINVYAYPVNPLIEVDIDGLRGRGGGGGRSTGRKGKAGPTGANARCPLGGTHSSRRMVDQMIRDGHIVIEGDKKYQNAVRQDLNRIASSNTGRNTLSTIRDSGHPVTIRNGPFNGCAGGIQPGARPLGSVPQDPRHGVGTGTGAPSTVAYNPHDTSRPPESPPDAALNHELGHAAHNSAGTNQRDSSAPVPATVKNSPNLEEHSTTANEDNAYRRERGLPERDNYNKLPGEP